MDWWAIYSYTVFSFTIFLCYRWLSQVWTLQFGVRISTRQRNEIWKEKGKIRPSIANMAALPNLPEEVILNILSRLPVKLLCKLKCVSHNWLNGILFDSYFKNLQRCQSLKSPRLLSYEIMGLDDHNKEKYCTVCLATTDIASGEVLDEFDMKIARSCTESDSSFVQLSFCRDLICIFSDQEIAVCNPSNHEFMEFRGCGKNFPNSIGIGYVASSEEYKVVRLYPSFTNDTKCLGCQIFTVKDGSDDYTCVHRVIDWFTFKPFGFRPLEELSPICVNGIMYWMMKHSSIKEENLAYYMDLQDQSFGCVPCPRLGVEDKILLAYEDVKLLEFRGLLCLQCCLPMISSIAFYALKDVHLGIWEKLYVMSPFPKVHGNGKALILGAIPSTNQEDELVISQISIKNKTRSYYLYSRGVVKRASIEDQPMGRVQVLYFDGLLSFRSHKFSPTRLIRDI